MNKKLKKIVALLLTALMLMSMMSFASFAEETTEGSGEEVGHQHKMFIDLIIEMWTSIFSFFKYIFNDVFLGVPA